MVKVGYYYILDHGELMSFDLLPLPAGNSRFCPIVQDSAKNVFVIKAPFDLNLEFNGYTEKNEASVNLIQTGLSISDEKFEDHISITERSSWNFENRPVIQLLTHVVFIADEHIIMEYLPPFRHYHPDLHVLFANGSFDIYDWQRPMMIAFDWMDTSKPIKIKRGDPLGYIRFNTPKSVKLVRLELTPELFKLADRGIRHKNHIKGFSRIAMNKAGLIRRGRKFIK